MLQLQTPGTVTARRTSKDRELYFTMLCLLSLVVQNVSFIQMTTDPPDWISKSKPTFTFAFRRHFNSPQPWIRLTANWWIYLNKIDWLLIAQAKIASTLDSVTPSICPNKPYNESTTKRRDAGVRPTTQTRSHTSHRRTLVQHRHLNPWKQQIRYGQKALWLMSN